MFSVLGKCIFIFLDIGVEWASLISLMGEFAAELIPGIHELFCKHVLHINYCYDFRVCWGGGETAALLFTNVRNKTIVLQYQ